MSLPNKPPEWKCGDTFFYQGPKMDKHLQVVLSDPSLNPAQIVIVNFSTLKEGKKYQERTCIIEVGEHPFVVQRTCVPYYFAYSIPIEFLEDRETRGLIQRQQPLSGIVAPCIGGSG